jgi:hypothetical protein
MDVLPPLPPSKHSDIARAIHSVGRTLERWDMGPFVEYPARTATLALSMFSLGAAIEALAEGRPHDHSGAVPWAVASGLSGAAAVMTGLTAWYASRLVKDFLRTEATNQRTNQTLSMLQNAHESGAAPRLGERLHELVTFAGPLHEDASRQALYSHAENLLRLSELESAVGVDEILRCVQELVDSGLNGALEIGDGTPSIANNLVTRVTEAVRENRSAQLSSNEQVKACELLSFGGDAGLFWYQQRLKSKGWEHPILTTSHEAPLPLLRLVLQDVGLDRVRAAEVAARLLSSTGDAHGWDSPPRVEREASPPPSLREMDGPACAEWIAATLLAGGRPVAHMLQEIAQSVGGALPRIGGNDAAPRSFDSELPAPSGKSPYQLPQLLLKVLDEDPIWAEPALALLLRKLLRMDDADRSKVLELVQAHVFAGKDIPSPMKGRLMQMLCLTQPAAIASSPQDWESAMKQVLPRDRPTLLTLLCLSAPKLGAQILGDHCRNLAQGKGKEAAALNEEDVATCVAALWLGSPAEGRCHAESLRLRLPEKNPDGDIARQLIVQRQDDLQAMRPLSQLADKIRELVAIDTLPEEPRNAGEGSAS